MAIIRENPTLIISDAMTGEVIDTTGEGDSIHITRKEQRDFLIENVQVNKDRDFIMIWGDVGEILAKENLTSSQFQIIFGILKHIEYDSGILKMGIGRYPDRKLNATDIMRICEMNDKTYYRAMKGLVDRKIIGQTKVGREVNFIVNPFIFYRGGKKNKRFVPRTIYELFKNTKWNVNGE